MKSLLHLTLELLSYISYDRFYRFCTTTFDYFIITIFGALLGLAAVYYGLLFYIVLRFSRSW
jgi:hypothetical protein